MEKRKLMMRFFLNHFDFTTWLNLRADSRLYPPGVQKETDKYKPSLLTSFKEQDGAVQNRILFSSQSWKAALWGLQGFHLDSWREKHTSSLRQIDIRWENGQSLRNETKWCTERMGRNGVWSGWHLFLYLICPYRFHASINHLHR